MSPYYITVEGLGPKLREQVLDTDTIIELQPYGTMITQLLDVPPGAMVRATPHPEWPKLEKERFTRRIEETLVSIAVSRDTHMAYQGQWTTNALKNYDAAMTADPVDKIPLWGDIALVCGSGPSHKDYNPPGGWTTFVAWSADPVFLPDYIGHCDHRPQDVQYTCGPSVIFTPSCSPQILELHPNQARYVYFDRGNPVNWFFAAKRNLPDHDPIVGNVVDMLTHCAILAGHTRIKLIGVDMCCKSLEAFKIYRDGTDVTETLNYRGETVYTDMIFDLYRRNLEELISQHPEIEFTNGSPDGVVIEGAPYDR